MRLVLLLLLCLIGCAKQPELPLDQNSLVLWLEQRGLETKGLQMTARPTQSGSASGLPMRVIFSTPKPQGALESWRLELREELSAWLTEKGHPEGQCTSVDLTPEQDRIKVDIQIVCR